MPITIEVITLFLALASGIATAVGFVLNRNNVHAQTLKTLSETVTSLSTRVQELEEDGRKDNARIQALEHLLSICVIGLQTLTNQIIRDGSDPEWFPPEELDQFITHFISSHKKEPKEDVK